MSASAAATRAVLGGAFILIAESAILADWTAVSTWTTPICWWGYLLILDAFIEFRVGRSPFVGRPGRFFGWTSLSILFWLVFEAYNLRLRNWEYVGLPDDHRLRLAGYLASFATILPAVFLTAESLRILRLFTGLAWRPIRPGPRAIAGMALAGALCLVVPPLLPEAIGRGLFAPVWVGFILLLEPLNRRLEAPSILRDLEAGEPGTLLRLLLSGYLCGFLWEFWNYWAAARWVYHLPYLSSVRIFEMPVVGFLGFGPFAVELYAMYGPFEAARRRLAALRKRQPSRPFSL
jgi:hypothetical protein